MSRKAVSPAEHTAHVLAAKWKPTIITLLAFGSPRFGKIHTALPGVSHKVLIEQLRELERDGVISRQVKVGGYRRVHYSLSYAGRELLPILELMEEWALRHACSDRDDAGTGASISPAGSEPAGA